MPIPGMKSAGGTGRPDLIRRTKIALVLLPLVAGCSLFNFVNRLAAGEVTSLIRVHSDS